MKSKCVIFLNEEMEVFLPNQVSICTNLTTANHF